MTYYNANLHSNKKVISPQELKEQLDLNNSILIDVRQEAEFNAGHIEGSKLMPLGDLPNRIDEIDKDKQVYIICRSGSRSDFAAKILRDNGFEKVTNIVPGIMAWEGELVSK